ncbi:hypothetical protein RUND412_007698 [Rhizina undulata]
MKYSHKKFFQSLLCLGFVGSIAADSVQLLETRIIPPAAQNYLQSISNGIGASGNFTNTTGPVDLTGGSDRVLLHALSQAQVEAVDICKSYAFSPTTANYHIADTGKWLRDYTNANRNRPYFKSHGLGSTIAYDYLGHTTWKCAVGTVQACHVRCTDVVEHVEDLVEARRVFFALASIGNFVNAVDRVHDGLVAAQVNVGLMASRMSFTFFWWTPSEEEIFRNKLYDGTITATIWACQSLLSSLVPIIPWEKIQDFILVKTSLALGKPIVDVGWLRDVVHNTEPVRQEGIDIINEAFQITSNFREYEINVPESYGGKFRWNPNGLTLGDWEDNNLYLDGRTWTREFYGEKHLPMTIPEDGSIPYRKGYFPDFRGRWKKHGFLKAFQHSYKDLMDLIDGTFLRLTTSGMNREIIRNEEGFQINKLPKEEMLGWGKSATGLVDKGMLSIAPNVSPGRLEGGQSFNDFKFDLQTRLWPIPDEPDRVWEKGSLEKKLKVAQSAFNIFANGFSGYMLPGLVRGMFSNWQGEDRPREQNDASLQFAIQESLRQSRGLIVDSVNRIMGTAEIDSDGATELSKILEYGSFLPADGAALDAWTKSDVESSLTKNIFYKTLNSALTSQKVYITCTRHMDYEKFDPSVDLVAALEDSCKADKSGPQNLKACIGDQVCYLYRWNDRGLKLAHHNEEPFGFDAIEDEPWEVDPAAIIKSSVSTYMLGIENTHNTDQSGAEPPLLSIGPSADAISNPEFPGVFSIPVCLSPYNWNTQLDNYGIHDDLNPHSSKKNLPCYCGPLGSQTQQVWEAVGFSTSGAKDRYARELCPRQIKKKIQEPLERYVAMCRLEVRNSHGIVKKGKDKFCDVVVKELEKMGFVSVSQEVDQEVAKAFMCKIYRSKDSKCERYKNTPFSRIWEETLQPILERKAREARGN